MCAHDGRTPAEHAPTLAATRPSRQKRQFWFAPGLGDAGFAGIGRQAPLWDGILVARWPRGGCPQWIPRCSRSPSLSPVPPARTWLLLSTLGARGPRFSDSRTERRPVRQSNQLMRDLRRVVAQRADPCAQTKLCHDAIVARPWRSNFTFGHEAQGRRCTGHSKSSLCPTISCF